MNQNETVQTALLTDFERRKKIDKIMKEIGKIVGCKNDSHPYN